MKDIKDCTRDELISMVMHYKERELYFAKLLRVPDAGQYRADWDAVILKLLEENRRLQMDKGEPNEDILKAVSLGLGYQLAIEKLTRALPFTEGSPLHKEIKKYLKDIPQPPPYRDMLEVALIHLMIWHGRYADDVDTSEKTDLNWILFGLNKPQRYSNVPVKEKP